VVTDGAKRLANDVAHEATDVMTRVRDSAKTTYEDVVEFGQHLPENVSAYGRALDQHVHEHPRMHLAIVAGASALIGASAGGKIVRLGLLAAAAYGAARIYPEVRSFLREPIDAGR
jgi:hypothetical protein